MAFTYDITTDRGQVRLQLSDTNASAYVFEDDEIDYFLSKGGSVDGGTAEGLRVLLVDAARRAKYFQIQGITQDTRGQVDAIRASLDVYGGSMPTLTVGLPALLPMDDGYVSTS